MQQDVGAAPGCRQGQGPPDTYRPSGNQDPLSLNFHDVSSSIMHHQAPEELEGY
jgi:hypothetical protein